MVKIYTVKAMKHHGHVNYIIGINFPQKILPGKKTALDIRIFLGQLYDFFTNFQWIINNYCRLIGNKFRKHGLAMLVIKYIEGQDFCLVNLGYGGLVFHIKKAYGIHLIIKEFHTIWSMTIYGEYVHNTTTDTEFPLHIHLVHPFIAHLYQLIQQIITLDDSAHPQLQTQGLKLFW